MKSNISSANFSLNQSGSTDDDDERDHQAGFSVQFDVLAIVLGVLIVAFNLLVLFLVAKRKHLRNPANYLLCSLAFSDLLTGLISIPLHLVCNIIQEDTVCIVAENFLRFTSISTILHLLGITTDRYLAIIHSLRYYIIVIPRRIYITIFGIWFVSFFVAFIQLIWTNPGNTNVHEDANTDAELTYDIFNLVLFFVIPLFVMVFVNSRIFYEVVRQSNIMRKDNTPGMDETKKKQRREWKAALIFAIMFVTYCVCWLPFFIVRLQHRFGNEFFEMSPILEYVFIYLRFLCSLLNPCLYVLGKSDFRSALKRKRERNRGNSISKGSVTKYSFLKTTQM